MKASFMIAAPTSGSGKTTISRGLMALFTQKGYTVQPFKCGPDYIDTKFHAAVCGRPSVNLDTFMASAEHVRELFASYGAEADVCIVEGMMGLFDGYDRDRGSSAEIARVLGIPVVLVVDARSAAYSMAPLIQGFINFNKDVRIAGVIYNKVGSDRHFQMLRQVCEDLSIECFGYLPKSASLEQESRYLGLDFSEKAESTALVSLLEAHVNWQRIVGHASQRDIISEEPVTLGSVTYYAPQPQFVDTSQYFHITNDKLPHWHQEDKTVFVTFRLADSLPQSKLQELQAFKAQWLREHPQPWDDNTRNDYEKSVRQKTDRWLDQGYGSCILALPDVRKMVADALLAKHGTSYWLHHFVIMPNHVHLLVTPIGNNSLTKTFGGIKQYTARIINLDRGTKGDVWQRRTFDHLVRNESQYERCISYIKDNPKYIPSGTFTLFSALVGHASQRDNRQLLSHAGKRDLLRVMIARNEEAFSFIYQETIDRLGDVTFFDPEKDVPNLDGIDLLYLPGGYPEKHLEALVKNYACRKAIKDYAERGGRIIAECGGMMYLCHSIVGEASPTTEYPMCYVLPYTITARKADRKLSLGYRRFELDGKEYRGHEFHYTQFLGEVPKSIVQVYNAKGEPVDTPVFKYKNVLASYTHLYAGFALNDK
jgi:cobyrinic acid a,c-diamide synthase